jgi:DNA-binding transcriptional regulator YhcF (GntR family)
MIKLIDILKEITQFSNWKIPSLSQLKQEFKVEQILKNRHYWNSKEDFLEAVKNGKVVTITPEEDQNIGNRSYTESYDELLDLIKSYRSYPEYRNEKTLKAIYDGFKNNQPMDLPIVIELSNGRKRIFSGNTRMDIAFQLGINPKVLLVKTI